MNKGVIPTEWRTAMISGTGTTAVTMAQPNWNDSDNTGTFQLNVNNSTSDSNDNVSAHLKFSKGSYCLLNPRCKSGV